MSFPCGSDPWLDARLRNVPLPPGMLARLHETVDQLATESAQGSGGDDVGPKLFRPNQPVPIGETLSNEQMDRLLTEVSLPPGLLNRLERISQEPRRRVRPRTLALAASLLLALGVAYAWRATVFSLLPQGNIGEVAKRSDNPPAVDSANVVATSTIDRAIDDEPEIEFTEPVANPAIDELRRQLMAEANVQLYAPAGIEKDPSSPSAVAESNPSKAKIFAADRVLDQLPELESVEWDARPRGVAVPLLAEYDLRFQSRFGQHPFVVPAANKQLSTLRVPLVSSSESYELAWRQLAEGKLPAANQVRVEEFLAAFDYGFDPAAPGALALRTAGGPTPWSNGGTNLLQVGVQAGSALPATPDDTSGMVARNTSLTLTFNPQAVAAYRLLGHESRSLSGGNTAPLQVDFAAGQTATALIEVKLRPQGGNEIATVELTWKHPATGDELRTRQQITRLQFAKLFAESPLSLQTAALAGYTAELLRGSQFTAGSRSLASVRLLAEQCSPLVWQQADVKALLAFVEAAEKVRLRSGKSRGSPAATR
jgi:hypothetical protein